MVSTFVLIQVTQIIVIATFGFVSFLFMCVRVCVFVSHALFYLLLFVYFVPLTFVSKHVLLILSLRIIIIIIIIIVILPEHILALPRLNFRFLL